jgi:Bacterial regulatory proteins, tetR family
VARLHVLTSECRSDKTPWSRFLPLDGSESAGFEQSRHLPAVIHLSRPTVDALLGATAHISVKDGYDRASIDRIAHGAGVSIGSLYQYFPSKEALYPRNLLP